MPSRVAERAPRLGRVFRSWAAYHMLQVESRRSIRQCLALGYVARPARKGELGQEMESVLTGQRRGRAVAEQAAVGLPGVDACGHSLLVVRLDVGEKALLTAGHDLTDWPAEGPGEQGNVVDKGLDGMLGVATAGEVSAIALHGGGQG